MKNPTGNNVAKSVAMLLALVLALLVPHGGAFAQDRPAFSQAQLEQMLAPIALYPDPLLSQILMASTYPLEVVEAVRWLRNHPNLNGEDAVRAAVNENWDPSVKSLLAFPHVLARMDEDLQWLQTLGDAFLAQEPQVMDAVQSLRRRAQAAGNLRSDERQRITETGPVLVVQPADPQIIYVPYYDPRVVYGSWWWPHYAPVYWRPFPGYGVWPGTVSGFFYWGPSIRISIGYFFGGFDWSHRHVRVVHSNFNHHGAAHRRVIIHHDRPPGAWHHDPVHRRGVAYRAPEVQRQFAGHGTRPGSGRQPDREDARRQDPQRVQSQPGSNRHDESRNDAPRTEVQAVRDTPAQPAIQRVTKVQVNSGANPRADRRDHAKGPERGDRSVPVERGQASQAPAHGAIPATGAVPQAQGNRGNATPAPARGEQAGRSARPRAGESAREPRPAPPARHEAQREAGRQKEAQGTPDARPGSGWQRSANADSALQQMRQQR